jgi:hypothetical protein
MPVFQVDTGVSSKVQSNATDVNLTATNGVFMNYRSGFSEAGFYFNPIGGTAPSVVSPLDTTLWTPLVFTGSAASPIFPITDFSLITGGMQYTGVQTKTFTITLEICAETDNNDQNVQFAMYKTASYSPSDEIAETFGCFFTKDNTKTGGTSSTFKYVLSQNDYIHFVFRTPRATNDLTLIGYKITANEI